MTKQKFSYVVVLLVVFLLSTTLVFAQEIVEPSKLESSNGSEICNSPFDYHERLRDGSGTFSYMHEWYVAGDNNFQSYSSDGDHYMQDFYMFGREVYKIVVTLEVKGIEEGDDKLYVRFYGTDFYYYLGSMKEYYQYYQIIVTDPDILKDFGYNNPNFVVESTTTVSGNYYNVKYVNVEYCEDNSPQSIWQIFLSYISK